MVTLAQLYNVACQDLYNMILSERLAGTIEKVLVAYSSNHGQKYPGLLGNINE